jgi:hypothetical protein
MIQTKNENQRLKDEVVRKVSKNEDVQKGPKKITLEKLKALASLKKSSKETSKGESEDANAEVAKIN